MSLKKMSLCHSVSAYNMSLKKMSLCHSVSAYNMPLKNMSLCHSVSAYNMPLKNMSLCHSVSAYNMSLKNMSLCHSVYVKYTHSVSPLLVSSKGLGDEDDLYRILTNILLIFFLFSFFLFNFVPIIKEIRTINRKILRTKHLLN